MSTDDYLFVINRAHSAYMKSRLGQGSKEMHIADLAIESTGFFEVAYHVIDALAEKAHSDFLKDKARQSQKQALKDLINHIDKPAPKPKKERKQVKEK